MIRVAQQLKVGDAIDYGGVELLQRTEAIFTWIDIENARSDEEQAIFNRFQIHPLAIHDATRERHPPKIEAFDDFLFVLLRGLDGDATAVDFRVIQLGIFVSDHFVITRHTRASSSVNWLLEAIRADPARLKNGGVGILLQLMNRLARRYIEILLALEHRLDEIEEEVFERPHDGHLAELTGYKSRLRNLSRIARYHLLIATRLHSRDDPLIPEALRHESKDLYEQVERTQSLAEMHYQIADDITNGYLALSSHRLNRVMQILTVITVIFVPLTFIAGIYGMNFANMPELQSANGYFVVLGIMLVIAICQLIYFRRKRWV